MKSWVAGVLGVALLFVVLLDAFETIVLPRRVARRLRLTRLFYRATWSPFAAVGRLIRAQNRRENYLSYYGPLSLLILLALWAVSLVVGFGLLQYAAGSRLQFADGSPVSSIASDFYFSGTNFFTLGLGDIIPQGPWPRLLTVAEAAIGFALLAGVIGYLPAIYQAFSRREANITLLDARAGSPPSAVELLRRHAGQGGVEALGRLLHDWERWAAELLETHLSYPVLAYFRSQHTNQSWLTALTTMLDASAVLTTIDDEVCARQARLTFAMARHAVVDLAQVFSTPPRTPPADRLPPPLLARLHAELADTGLPLPPQASLAPTLQELRQLYEPYVTALGRYLLQTLPAWHEARPARDNWQRSAWDRQALGVRGGPHPLELGPNAHGDDSPTR